MEMDNRSRFVILVNLGTVYLTLSEVDAISRGRRRAEAREVWNEALALEEGGTDRAKVALDTGNLYFEDGIYGSAARLYKRCIEHDEPATGLSKAAHERLGATNRLVGTARAGGSTAAYSESVRSERSLPARG